jgi:hypothetical protein
VAFPDPTLDAYRERFIFFLLIAPLSLGNPSSMAALTFVQVKNPSRRRVRHARRQSGVLAAFYTARRGRLGTGLIIHGSR